MLFWNVWDQLDAARALISDADAVHATEPKGALLGVS
jgi:hypothetical protein